MTTTAPMLELLAWIGERERSYAETIDVWHSHCPRLMTWEDALADGLIEITRGKRVVLTVLGRAMLAR